MRGLLFMIYRLPLAAVCGLIPAGILLWGLLGCLGRRRESLWRALNGSLCLAALGAVYYAALGSRSPIEAAPVWIPLHSLVEARLQPELYRSMLMNVLLFVPLGLFLPYALPAGTAHRQRWTLLAALGVSAAVELAQLWLGLGRCETDDVLMALCGAGLGSLAWRLQERLCRKIT